MSIQPSLIIWTVICFLVFALIIDKLLFVPVTEVIDKRKKRIADAESKARADRETLEAAEREHDAKLLESQSESRALTEKMAETRRKESENDVLSAKSAAEESLSREKEALERSREKRDSELSSLASSLAREFAESYTVSHGKAG